VKGGKIGNGPGEGRSTAAVRVADGEARRGRQEQARQARQARQEQRQRSVRKRRAGRSVRRRAADSIVG
jgi:hypothetical protein